MPEGEHMLSKTAPLPGDGDAAPPQRKKRTVLVRKATAKAASKTVRRVVVARKPRADEDVGRLTIKNVGSPTRVKGVRYDHEGNVLARSIVGPVGFFNEVNRQIKLGEAPLPPTLSTGGGGMNMTADDFAGASNLLSPRTAAATGAARLQGLKTDAAEAHKAAHHRTLHEAGLTVEGGNRLGATTGAHNRKREMRAMIADPTAHRANYLDALALAGERATDLRTQETLHEAKLLEMLPINEKFAMNSEAKVIKLWHERQKDWARLQSRIANNLGKDPSKLVMANSNEYREQTEAYQAIQSAIPLHERYGISYWEMSLRGQGARFVPIGNIFSGLFCPLKDKVPPPKIIRRPALLTGGLGAAEEEAEKREFKASSWREDPYFKMRKHRLKRTLDSIRSHDVGVAEGNRLVVVSADLFQWARASSAEYFDHTDARAAATLAGAPAEVSALAEAKAEAEAEAAAAEAAAEAQAAKASGAAHAGPTLELGPSRYVVLESRVGESTERAIHMANTGTTVIFYEWRRAVRDETIVYAHPGPGPEPGSAVGAVPPPPPSCFFCHSAKGCLLPGAEKQILFGFSSTRAGEFSEDWVLDVLPDAHIIGLEPAEFESPVVPGKTSVRLTAHALQPDTCEHSRKEVRHRVGSGAFAHQVQQVLYEIVRAVRPRRREDEVRALQKATFEAAHSQLGLHYTVDLYDAVGALYERALEAVAWVPPTCVRAVIAGAPASGKGTQCALMVEKYGCVHLSTGDMLRAAVAAETAVGREAKAVMEAGGLVPDAVVTAAVLERLAQPDCTERGWLLDGFPRTRAQAEALAAAGVVVDAFVLLEVPDADLVGRVVGRRSDPVTGEIYHVNFNPPPEGEVAERCTQRADDTADKCAVRLEAYHANVDAVRGCFDHCTAAVDGARAAEDVFGDVGAALDAFAAAANGGERAKGVAADAVVAEAQALLGTDLEALGKEPVDASQGIVDAAALAAVEALDAPITWSLLWNGTVDAVSAAIDTVYVEPEPLPPAEEDTGAGDDGSEAGSAAFTPRVDADAGADADDGAAAAGGGGGGGGGEDEDDEDEDDNDDDEDEDEDDDDDDDERVPPPPPPTPAKLVLQRELRADLSRIVGAMSMRPLPSVEVMARDAINALSDAVVDACETSRFEAGLPEDEALPAPLETPFPSFLSAEAPGKEDWETLATSAEAQAAAAPGGGLPAYRALAYAKGSAAAAAALGAFGGSCFDVQTSESAAFDSAHPHPLDARACARLDPPMPQAKPADDAADDADKDEDDASDAGAAAADAAPVWASEVEGRRVVVQADLDVGADMFVDPQSPGGWAVGDDGPVCRAKLAGAKDLLKRLLKSGAGTVVVVTSLTPPPVGDDELADAGGLDDDASATAVSAAVAAVAASRPPMTAAPVAELLAEAFAEASVPCGRDGKLPVAVEFCKDTAELEARVAKQEAAVAAAAAEDGPREQALVLVLEHGAHAEVVPAPAFVMPPKPPLEDCAFPFMGEDDGTPPAPAPAPTPPLGAALSAVADVLVCDSLADCADASRALEALAPTSGLRLAGPGLRGDLAALAAVVRAPPPPAFPETAPEAPPVGRLAIVGGGSLAERVRLLDTLIDTVDEIAVGGRCALAFLAALGHATGAAANGLDQALVPVARKLLAKAHQRGCKFVLPIDFVVGDVLVDEHGVVGDRAAEDDEEDEDDGDGEGGDTATAADTAGLTGLTTATGGEGDDEDDEDDDLDLAGGFDYDGDITESTTSQGLAADAYVLDIGQKTTQLVKDAIERSSVVLFAGLLGVAECSAFQAGTREVVEALVAAHDERQATVVVCGASSGVWAARFAALDDDVALGKGEGVTHVVSDPVLGKRLLEGLDVPGVALLTAREPQSDERLTDEAIARKLEELPEAEDGDDEDDEDDEGEDGADY